MLNFRNTRIIFVIAILSLIGYDFNHDVSVWGYIAIVVVYSFVLFLGSYFIQSGFFLKAFCSGSNSKNQIAITFDDGPHENTNSILDALKEYKATGNFFCIGKNFQGKEAIVKRIADEDHVVSNHSFSHNNFFDFFSVKKLDEDVSKTDELIFQITGKKNKLFRPPFGVATPNIARMMKAKKYSVIGWSVRSYDTTIKDHDKLMNRIFSRIKNGSVILLHDTTPGIEIVVRKILEYARDRNFKVVSIEEMFKIKAYESV